MPYLVEIILWIDGIILKLVVIDTATIACGGTDAAMKSTIQTRTLCPPRTDTRSIIQLKHGEALTDFVERSGND